MNADVKIIEGDIVKTEKMKLKLVKEFSDELEAENVVAETIIQQTRDHLSNLQAIGAKVFRRWAKLIKII